MSMPMSLPSHAFQASLPELTVLRVEGADATDFLQGQLTQDVKSLAADEARLAAYCTAKGRMLASLVLWRADAADGTPGYDALISTDIAEAVAKRLRMFVLRAKVTLTVRTDTVSGVWASQALADAPAAWQVHRDADGNVWIGAPAAPEAAVRCWRIAASPAAGATAQAGVWYAQQIQAGLPWIQAATQELFTPQMANLDLIGGVSFTKGCYPGQEVVARAHYRGKQKRRALIGQAAAGVTTAPGQDVWDAQHTSEPIGRILNVAHTGAATFVLFEAPFESLASADLRLNSVDGTPLQPHPLPYALDSH